MAKERVNLDSCCARTRTRLPPASSATMSLLSESLRRTMAPFPLMISYSWPTVANFGAAFGAVAGGAVRDSELPMHAFE